MPAKQFGDTTVQALEALDVMIDNAKKKKASNWSIGQPPKGIKPLGKQRIPIQFVDSMAAPEPWPDPPAETEEVPRPTVWKNWNNPWVPYHPYDERNLKTPIPIFSSIGYRRFCKSWWREVFRLPVRWARDIKSFIHRGRYGWTYEDTWSLDNYLARVMGSTLLHLSKHAHGCPANYCGNAKSGDNLNDQYDESSKKWSADLERWGQAFRDYYIWQENNLEFQYDHGDDKKNPRGYAARKKDEAAIHKNVQTALKEMGPWFPALWD